MRKLILIILIIGIIGASGCTETTKNTSENSTTTNAVIKSGEFENEWVKFQMPSDLSVLDESTSEQCLINIYNGSVTDKNNLVISMNFWSNNKQSLIESLPGSNKTTIAGYEAIIGKDDSLYAYLFLKNNTGNVTTFIIDADPNYQGSLDKIKDSLVIKKIPNL